MKAISKLMVVAGMTILTQSTAHGFLENLFKPRPAKPKVVAPPAPMTKQQQLAQYGSWTLRSPYWTEIDEQNYSNFVKVIGLSGCSTVDSCIRNNANPFRYSDPPKELFTFWSDCADWPYFLRSYFAWKNGLPMAYINSFSPLPNTPEQQARIDSGEVKEPETRYSYNGNVARSRVRLPYTDRMTNYFEVHSAMQNSISTGTFRMDPRSDQGDLYTPVVNREGIRPGTVVYDPSGHIGVVYDVTSDGEVMVFDALVDRKSISPRRAYSGEHYKRSRIEHGGWFQNFRNVGIDNSIYDRATGTFYGGTMSLMKNSDSNLYSIEMFGNTKTADGKNAYSIQGIVTTSFQEFLRRRMFTGQFKLDVVSEFKKRLGEFCADFQSRQSLVQDGTSKGIAAKPHIEKLPDNIYGGDGEWDVYSTPGGDVRRRLSVGIMVDRAKEFVQYIRQGHKDYSYNGRDLKSDLIKAATETLNSCSVTYTNTAGKAVYLNLNQTLMRIPYMSFSPFHCVELRWGATSAQELASCPDMRDETKMRWYDAQQSLRNSMVRDTSIFTGYTLPELELNADKVGPRQAPNFNLLQRLQTEL